MLAYHAPMLSDHALPQWLERFKGGGWVAEIKLDGHRCLMSSDATYTRAGHRLDLPHIQQHIPQGWLLDGELMTPVEGFAHTAKALVRARHSLRFVAFDVLTAFGVGDVRNDPHHVRAGLLERFDQIQRVYPIELESKEHLRSVFDDAMSDGCEGLILKHRDSRYIGGNRTQWKKLKTWGPSE